MPSRRRTSSPSSVIFNLPFLILLLSTIAFLLFFLLIFPSFLSFSSSHKLRPTIAVKKSWDSLNVFLVLFAILCGVFARRNDDDSASGGDDNTTDRNALHSDHSKEENGGHESVSDNWFDQYSTATPASGGLRRLKRNSSSYPDLRQESLWQSGGDDDRSRFFDDFEIHKYRSPPSSSDYVNHFRRRSVLEEESTTVKEIPVDTYKLRSTPKPPDHQPPASPSATPPPPPPPPPPPVVTSNYRQKPAHRTVSRKEKMEEVRNRPLTPPPPPPPPPPRLPPTPPVVKGSRSERNHWKSDRKRTNATKELKMVLISLYHQSTGKKKLKRKNPYDESLHTMNESPSFTVPSPPPPPPPPPPASVFQNFFRKGSKNKRIHSFSSPPMPPPPPPPPRPSLSSSKRWSKRKNQVPPPPPAPPPPPSAPLTPPRVYHRWRNPNSAGRPPLPTRINNVCEENVNSGGQSPLIPMPPPPPPPPFKVPGFKFRMKGDYVKIRSANSSRCSSPELDDVDNRSTERVNVMDGRCASVGSVFCPSPDVNAKADTFIARLRGEWRLENEGAKKYGP